MVPKKSMHIKIETPRGKTYGECIQAEIDSIRLIDGVFITTLQIINKPKPLPRNEAIAYYTAKLKLVWKKHGIYK